MNRIRSLTFCLLFSGAAFAQIEPEDGNYAFYGASTSLDGSAPRIEPFAIAADDQDCAILLRGAAAHSTVILAVGARRAEQHLGNGLLALTQSSRTFAATSDHRGFARMDITSELFGLPPGSSMAGHTVHAQWMGFRGGTLIAMSDGLTVTPMAAATPVRVEYSVKSELRLVRSDSSSATALVEGRASITLHPQSRPDTSVATLDYISLWGDGIDGSGELSMRLTSPVRGEFDAQSNFHFVGNAAVMELGFEGMLRSQRYTLPVTELEFDQRETVIPVSLATSLSLRPSVQQDASLALDLRVSERLPADLPMLASGQLSSQGEFRLPQGGPFLALPFVPKKELCVRVHIVRGDNGLNAATTLARVQQLIQAANDIFCPQCCIQFVLEDSDEDGMPDVDYIDESRFLNIPDLRDIDSVTPGCQMGPSPRGRVMLSLLRRINRSDECVDLYFINSFVNDPGCPTTDGVTAGSGRNASTVLTGISDGLSAAHELGHALGLPHGLNLMQPALPNATATLSEDQCNTMRMHPLLRNLDELCLPFPLGQNNPD